MIRNSPKTLTWLIKLAFFTLFPASVKTVYRVQNCIPKMVIHRLLWASNSKSTFITKFEYWKEFSDSITSRVHTAGLMGKDYLILMTIEYKSCWHALLRTYHCSLVKRFIFFQLTTTRIIFALEFHLLVKSCLFQEKSEKIKNPIIM